MACYSIDPAAEVGQARIATLVAHANEGYCLASESTSPSFISVGRFWGELHWPLLGDPWGKNDITLEWLVKQWSHLEKRADGEGDP